MRTPLSLILFLLAMATPILSRTAQAADTVPAASELSLPQVKAKLIPDAAMAGVAGIQSLQWSQLDYDVQYDTNRAEAPYVEISGRITQEEWVLLWKDAKVPLSAEAANRGQFKLKIFIEDKLTPVLLYAVNDMGNVEQLKVIVAVPEFSKLEAMIDRKLAKQVKSRRYAFSPSVGVTMLSYSQTSPQWSTSISEKAMTAKISAQYFVAPPTWDLGLTAFVNAMAFSSDHPDQSVQIFGINGRVGYSIASVPKPWKLTLMGGIYYTSMVGNHPDGAFGFKGLMGPQVFPVLRYTLPKGDTLGGYFKWAAVGNAESSLSFANREVAAGLSWGYLLPTGKAATLALDFANLSFVTQSTRISATSLTLSVGYSF